VSERKIGVGYVLAQYVVKALFGCSRQRAWPCARHARLVLIEHKKKIGQNTRWEGKMFCGTSFLLKLAKMPVCPGCKMEEPLFWTRKGKRCFGCGGDSILRIVPSQRQQKRFSQSFSLASFAEVLLLPIAMPGLLAASLLVALRFRDPLFWKMFLGAGVAGFLWIVLLPGFIQSPELGSALLLGLFASLLLFLQALPAISFSRNLLLRGRGWLAGWQLASGLFVTVFSVGAPFLLLLFV
jgi:hypothetical protein